MVKPFDLQKIGNTIKKYKMPRMIELENSLGIMDLYRIIRNTPAVKIRIAPHQLPPKGWARRTPRYRRSTRGKNEIKRLGNVIPSNIIKFVKL